MTWATKLLSIRIIAGVLVLLLLFALVVFYSDVLNRNSGAIQAISTIILVIITGMYAYSTAKMSGLMTKQVISDIQMSNIIVGSPFIEDWFLERLEKNPEQIDKDSYFDFSLLFDLYNRSSASGSISKPVLVLESPNDFQYEIPPKTKEVRSEKVEERGAMTIYNETITDLGGAVFLRGGDFQKVELEYMLHDFPDELLQYIKRGVPFVRYHIKFTDNLGKDSQLEITNVQPEEKSHRK